MEQKGTDILHKMICKGTEQNSDIYIHIYIYILEVYHLHKSCFILKFNYINNLERGKF